MSITGASIGYVPTIPLKVNSDNEAESSAGEERNDEFPKEYFNNPLQHFRMHPAPDSCRTFRRGKISSRNVLPLECNDGKKSQALSDTLSKIEELTREFQDESFGRTAEESQSAKERRLKVVIGLNKMRSISESRNRSLKQAVSLPHEEAVFGFFWYGAYEERSEITGKWSSCSFGRVRKFYRQLKKKNRLHAKNFREELEKKRGHMVPYRGLRERLAQSTETQEAVRSLREDKMVNRVYMGMFDADSLSLHAPDDRGVFSHYDEMIAKHPRLEIGSCGYLFTGQKTKDSPVDPIMKVASEADLRVRHATAQFFAYGIYYPEPSCIIRIRDDKPTIEYSFETSDAHYASPQESIVILEQIRKKFRSDQGVAVFGRQGAIPTTTPERAEKPFAAHYNDYKKIVRWTERDMMRMRGVAQSHLHPKKWADNLIRDLDVEGMENHRIVISLLSRLFHHYDAVSMAQDRLEEQRKINPHAAFPTEFIAILKHYAPEFMQVKKIERRPVDKETEATKRWKTYDEIDSLEGLRDALAEFLSEDEVERVEKAAKESGKEVVKLFAERFEMQSEALTLALMEDFLKDLEPELEKRFWSYKPMESALQILRSNALTKQEALGAPFRTLLKNERIKKDPFGLLPMHWAAMFGDSNLIKKLKTLKGEDAHFGSIDCVAVSQVTPLHCALRYMADNAVDPILMQELLDAKTAVMATKSGRVPLIMAIEDLEDPRSIVEQLFNYPVMNQAHKGQLLTALQRLHPAQMGESLLNSLIIHLPQEELGVISELLSLGMRTDTKGYALNDDDMQDLKETLQTVNIGSLGIATADPLPLAVRRGDVALVRALIDAGADVTECYDEEGNTPIMAAILHLENPYPMLELLLEKGASILDHNQGGAPPPLRYLIDQKPLNSKLFHFLLSKASREKGFAKFFFETGESGHGGLIEHFMGSRIGEILIARHADDPTLSKGTRAILRGMSGDGNGIDESSSDDETESVSSADASSNEESEFCFSDESLPSSGDEQW